MAADSPGLRDSVLNGKTGTLYEYGNIKHLSDAVLDLLQNETKRKEYADSAFEWAAQWNWSESAKKAIQLVEKNVRT